MLGGLLLGFFLAFLSFGLCYVFVSKPYLLERWKKNLLNLRQSFESSQEDTPLDKQAPQVVLDKQAPQIVLDKQAPQVVNEKKVAPPILPTMLADKKEDNFVLNDLKGRIVWFVTLEWLGAVIFALASVGSFIIYRDHLGIAFLCILSFAFTFFVWWLILELIIVIISWFRGMYRNLMIVRDSVLSQNN